MSAFANRTTRFHRRRRALKTRRAGAPPLEALEPRRLLATFTVDTFADVVNPADNLTSLREAVIASVATPEDDQIDIPAGNYVLALGQIEIHGAAGAMTLSGFDGTATIDAAGASRVFSIDSSEVAMEKLRITGGNASDGGGVFSFLSSLRISDSRIVGNAAERDGGGIHSELSTLVLDTVEVEENDAQRNGGGISALSVSAFQVVGSEVNFNSAVGDGGGMHLFRTDGGITDSRFSGNAAGRDGGGLALVSSRITGSELAVQNNTAVRDGGGGSLNSLSRLELGAFSFFAYNSAARDGGGVNAAGVSTLVIDDGGSAQNRAGRAGGGIGLASGSSARVVGGAEVSSNTALAGGGIGSVGLLASVEIVGAFVGGNLALLGGGIYGVSVDATSSTISGNIARFDGGGIHRSGSGNSFVRLNGVFMNGNEAQGGRGGAIFADQTVRTDINDSDIVFNTASGEGGGLFAGGFESRTRINESTIANNSASGGGGIYIRSIGPQGEPFNSTAISNSTISGNDGGQGLGGGIYLGRNVTFRAANVTVSGNRAAGGGGIASEWSTSRVANLTVTQNEALIGGGLLALREPFETGNTIYAGNTASVAGPDVWGRVRSFGGNLVGIRGFSSGWVASDQLGTNAAPIDPQLGPLTNNGGPTRTHMPADTSPAVDAGINSNALDVDGGTLLRDQRGFERIAGVRVDVGAVEVGAQQPFLIGGPYEIFESADLVLDATALLNPNAQQTFSWYLVPGGFTDNPSGVLIATGPNPTVPWSTLTQAGASQPGVYGIRMVLTEDGQEEVFTTTLTILPA